MQTQHRTAGPGQDLGIACRLRGDQFPERKGTIRDGEVLCRCGRDLEEHSDGRPALVELAGGVDGR